MKKMFFAAMSVAMVGSVSFANTEYSVNDVDTSVVYEQEDGAMSQEAIDMLSVDGVNIFGASDVQEWSGFPGRPGPGRPGVGRPGHGPGRPGPGHPGRPGHGPGRPGPRPPQYVTCFARDARGNMYRATANDARWAQRMAMDKCERSARFCRPAGCR